MTVDALPSAGSVAESSATRSHAAEGTGVGLSDLSLNQEQRQLLQQMNDIRDISPPVPYAGIRNWFGWWLIPALLVLTVVLVWWRRRKHHDPVSPELPPPEPAHEWALRELSGLGAQEGLADKAFYFRLSEIARRYLDRCFNVETLEKTTEELVPVLALVPLPDERRENLLRLLRAADPIKYADAVASRDQRRMDVEEVLDLVRATSPCDRA